MKKVSLYIISLMIVFAAIAVIMIYNTKYNNNINFPGEIEVLAGNEIFLANKRHELWQYPSSHDEISKITSVPMLTDKTVQQIIGFLETKEFSKLKGNNITVNLDNLKECKLEEVRYVSCAIYNSEKMVLLEKHEITNNQISIDIGELQTNINYYCEIMLVYPYSSIVNYDFKFIIQ